jgi:hypothetical protein
MFGNAISALRAGVELKNAETWKNRQLTINLITAILMAIVGIADAFGYKLPITEEIANSLAAGVWAAIGMFNVWATAATTTRVGLLSRPADPVETVIEQPVTKQPDPVKQNTIESIPDRWKSSDNFPVA